MIAAGRMANRLMIVLLATLAFAETTLAQTTARGPIELFGGYSYLRDPGNALFAATASDDAFPAGWFAGLAHRVWRRVDLVGEVGGQYKHGVTLDEDVTMTFHAVLAGPRVSIRLGPASGFSQALVGIVHGSASGFGASVSVTDLSIQPGGGIDVPLAGRFAARFEMDYRWIRGADSREAANQFRIAAGLVYR
jgi:hypothetical protein